MFEEGMFETDMFVSGTLWSVNTPPFPAWATRAQQSSEYTLVTHQPGAFTNSPVIETVWTENTIPPPAWG